MSRISKWSIFHMSEDEWGWVAFGCAMMLVVYPMALTVAAWEKIRHNVRCLRKDES